MRKVLILAAVGVLSITPAFAEDKPIGQSVGQDTADKTAVELRDPIPQELPYVGVGPTRTGQVLAYPIIHPIKFANKCTFPFRHPLVAFKNFGEATAPYHPGMASLGYIGGAVTPFGVFFRGN